MAGGSIFWTPQTILTGVGCSERVGDEAKKLGKRALLVTDQFLMKTEIPTKVKSSLEAAGLGVEVFAELAGEPYLSDVEKGLAQLKATDCDMVVAVGGGSSIDTSKGIAVLATNPVPFDRLPGAITTKKLPVVAVATTAGTGSEATRVMVITDPVTKVKMNPGSPMILPEVAVVDPALMVGMPPAITASTGMDALTHAIEAYVSRRAQPMSDCFALKAISLVAEWLPVAWADGANLEARSNMAVASLMAGMAFSNASTNLVHAMARPLGVYFNVPHGLANAVLLKECMEFSLPGSPKKFAHIASAMGKDVAHLRPLDAAARSVEAVSELCKIIGIPRLSQVGVSPDALRKVVGQMSRDAVASGGVAPNPRPAGVEQVEELYLRSL